MRQQGFKEKAAEAKKHYEQGRDLYLQAFCEKQDMDYSESRFLSDGFTAEIGDYYFDLGDIIIDLELDAAEGEIFEWQEYDARCCEHSLHRMNYETFIKGAPRIPNEAFERIENIKDRLQRIISETKETYKGKEE